MDSSRLTQTASQVEVPWYKELTGYHWWVLTVASLGWLFDTMDQRIFVLVRQPAMEALLPAGRDVKFYSGIATTVFMIGWAVGGLYFGMLSDRWGRAKTMMLAILVYAGFTGLSAASQNQWDFMLYRFLTGLGVGGEFAAGVTLVAETMPVRARAHALGLLQALSAVGNIIGSGIGYFVLPAYGWRAMFCVGVLPSLLVAVGVQKASRTRCLVAGARSNAPGREEATGSGAGSVFRSSLAQEHYCWIGLGHCRRCGPLGHWFLVPGANPRGVVHAA